MSRNGGVVGILNVPTTLIAKGSWRSTDVAHYKRAGIWPNWAGDPSFSAVKLLMHMNGSNGGTTFTDEKGHTGTNTSGTNSTTQVKFGTTSRNNASGRYVISHADMALGSGDFTVEGWFYTSAVGNMGCYSNGDGSGAGVAAFGLNNTGTMSIYAQPGATNSAATFSTSVWHHLAYVRSSGTLKLYYDGTSVISVSDSANYTSTTMNLGRQYDNTFAWNQYIDDFRITVGVARYTGTFTPPTAAFPDS